MIGFVVLGTLALAATGVFSVPRPPSVLKITACERMMLSLSCRDDKVIKIVSAVYGRKDRTTCPKGNTRNTSCRSPKSMSKVKEYCEGKPKCRVPASNVLFHDPCRGIHKYLQVRYRCVANSARTITRTIACENKPMSLSCPNGKVLRIKDANYGRTDRKTCPNKSIRTTKCRSATSLNKVKELCNGQTSCRVWATNRVFDDTCYGTYKYLEVTHRCVPAKRKVSCEHKTMSLSCRRGRILKIVSATYGRSDRTTCKSRSIKTTKCAAASSLSKVRQQCQDKRSCRVKASNGVFGDPCRGTYKYLTVTYECAAVRTKIACEKRTMFLPCPRNKLMKIVEATYGRTNRRTCPSKYIRTTKCSSTCALPTVIKRCQDKTRCKIVATNRVFGDPCVGTYKYLRVAYRCDDSMRSTTCENRRVKLSCGSGRSLHIVSAKYGRSNRTTCPHRSIKTTSCTASTSLAKVRALCEGKGFCVVTASNRVFGDPCRGTYKYMNIKYLCLA